MRRQLLCWLAGVPVGDGNGCNHAGAKFSNCQNATDTVGVTRKENMKRFMRCHLVLIQQLGTAFEARGKREVVGGQTLADTMQT